MSAVVAHLPGASAPAPSANFPSSQILTNEFSAGGSGLRYTMAGPWCDEAITSSVAVRASWCQSTVEFWGVIVSMQSGTGGRGRRWERNYVRTRQVVARLHLDRVRDLVVAEHVASHVDAVEVLDWAVSVPVGRRAIVGGRADPLKGAGVDSVDVDGLNWKNTMLIIWFLFTKEMLLMFLHRCSSAPAQPRRARPLQ